MVAGSAVEDHLPQVFGRCGLHPQVLAAGRVRFQDLGDGMGGVQGGFGDLQVVDAVIKTGEPTKIWKVGSVRMRREEPLGSRASLTIIQSPVVMAGP